MTLGTRRPVLEREEKDEAHDSRNPCGVVDDIGVANGCAFRSIQWSSAGRHQADYDRWKTELSNWGRWGKDDQIGAVNLITPAKRRQAAALVKEGFSVSLARDVDTEKAVDNPQPYERQMLAIGSDRLA